MDITKSSGKDSAAKGCWGEFTRIQYLTSVSYHSAIRSPKLYPWFVQVNSRCETWALCRVSQPDQEPAAWAIIVQSGCCTSSQLMTTCLIIRIGGRDGSDVLGRDFTSSFVAIFLELYINFIVILLVYQLPSLSWKTTINAFTCRSFQLAVASINYPSGDCNVLFH